MKMKLKFIRAQEAVEPISDPKKVDSAYHYWRVRIMVTTFIGYAVFYFVRKNLSAATPAMIEELHLSKVAIGSLWSLLYLTYGLSKLITGILGDKLNPRFLMPLGLFVSAIANIFFGLSSSLFLFGLFWAINGWFQGFGWPPCARLLSHWYSPNERGTKWAIWNTAHQLGGGIILILGGYLTTQYGWRSSFFVPSVIALITTFYLLHQLRDTPESLGLPPIEQYRNDLSGQSYLDTGREKMSAKELFFKVVLNDRRIWFLSLANFFVYLVRYGAMDWAPTFLVEVKGSTIANASLKTAGFEFLGIAGSVLAGWASDKYFRNRRYLVNFVYMLVLAFALLEFWLIPPGYPFLDALALASVGFLVYGPQMLVGVCAADIAGKKAASSATGFTGFFGYMGSIVSGAGTGWIVDHYQWRGGFFFFVLCALFGAFFFLFTREGMRVDQEIPLLKEAKKDTDFEAKKDIYRDKKPLFKAV